MTAMAVDPQIQQVIDALAASEFGPVHELTPAQALVCDALKRAFAQDACR